MSANPGNLRLPPQSIETEQRVIGGLLIGATGAYDRLGGILSVEMFYRDDHRRIFRHIMQIAEAGKSVDILTVNDSLESSGESGMAGGIGYLAELANAVFSTADIRQQAEIIVDRARKRAMIEMAEEFIQLGYSALPASEAMTEATGRLLDLADASAVKSAGPAHIAEVMGRTMAAIEARIGKGAVFGLRTGFDDLDRLTSGLHSGDLIIIAGRPAMGKELTLRSKVLLSSGEFKQMGDMMIGDCIASVDGGKSHVTGVFPQGVKPVYRVKFSDGRSVDAGLEHQFEVMCKYWPMSRVLTVKDLISKIEKKRYKSRIYIPNHSGDFGNDVDICVAPYLLGVLLGDGGFSSGSIKITTSYEHILNRIRPMLDGANLSLDQKISYRITTARGVPNNISLGIKQLGLKGLLSHEKFIPNQYLSASKETRLELLRGLIDTDGTVEKTGAMTYTTTSKKLADGVQYLARSLGAFASMSDRVTQYSYLGEKKDGLRAYTVFISCDHYGDFVTIPHKKSRIKVKSCVRRLNIESITYLGEEECQCISVSHERELYMSNDFIVTHNTALALNIAENVALSRVPTLVFSLEMSDTQLAMRTLAAVGNADLGRVRSGDLTDDEWDGVTSALGMIHEAPLWIDHTPGRTAGQMLSEARKIKRQYGLGLIVIDYLQLMRGTTNSMNRVEEVSDITRRLKLMARALECPVIALSQLSRKVEERMDKRPMMSDLRESGSIEQDADVIMMVYRDEYYNPDTPWKGMAEGIIVKNRMGNTGMVPMVFQGEHSRFRTADKGTIAAIREQAAQASRKPLRRGRDDL